MFIRHSSVFLPYFSQVVSNYNRFFDFYSPLMILLFVCLLVTGIQAGANISGDLRDPGKSIPKGTLLSLLISMTSYALFVVFAGGSAIRDASGNISDLVNGSALHMHPDCALDKVRLTLSHAAVFIAYSMWDKLILYLIDMRVWPAQFICCHAIDVRLGNGYFRRLLCRYAEHSVDKFIVGATIDSGIGHRSHLSGTDFLLQRLWQARRTVSWLRPDLFHLGGIFVNWYVRSICNYSHTQTVTLVFTPTDKWGFFGFVIKIRTIFWLQPNWIWSHR